MSDWSINVCTINHHHILPLLDLLATLGEFL